MNGYILVQTIGALEMEPYEQNGDLFEKVSDDFDYN
jgi:hypothetical protein